MLPVSEEKGEAEMAKLALPLPVAEQLCAAGFEADVAIRTPAS